VRPRKPTAPGPCAEKRPVSFAPAPAGRPRASLRPVSRPHRPHHPSPPEAGPSVSATSLDSFVRRSCTARTGLPRPCGYSPCTSTCTRPAPCT